MSLIDRKKLEDDLREYYSQQPLDAATDAQVPEAEPVSAAQAPEYPEDHKPGMRVPKGGSSCASCEYYKGDGTCGNEYFIKWNGSPKLPAPPDEYCSDWYEEK